MSEIIYYAVEFLFHAALLMVMLWVMIKLQGLNYNFIGLLGTAAAGGALDMIPYVGHAFAVVTLYFCITKMTRASMFPDASFTVGVSYALMFAVKILAFTALIGHLRPGGLDATSPPSDDPSPHRLAAAAAQPPATLPATKSQPTASSGDAPSLAPESNAAAEFVRRFIVKGATWNGDKSSVIFNFAGKTFTISQGDTLSLPDADKTVLVKLQKMNGQKLNFTINGEVASCVY